MQGSKLTFIFEDQKGKSKDETVKYVTEKLGEPDGDAYKTHLLHVEI